MMTVFGPIAVVEPAADQRAEGADERQDDAEDAEFQRTPAEDRRTVNPAECEDGGQAVRIEHAGDEKDQQARHRGQRLDRVP